MTQAGLPECNAIAEATSLSQVHSHLPGTRRLAVTIPTLTAPTGNTCAGGLLPVYRVYNKGFIQNDSNHRYTTSTVSYQQMQQLGWRAEGVVFCATAQ